MAKAFFKIAFAVLLVVISFSIVVEMRYSISLTEYFAYSVPLTQDEHEYLQSKEYLVFGIDNDEGPFSYVNEENGQWEGLLADYAKYLSEELMLDIHWKEIESSEIMDELINDKIDMSDFYADSDENGRYIETQCLYELKSIMMAKYSNMDITQFKDVAGKSIIIIEGDFMEERILEVIPKGQNTDFVYVKDVKEGLDALMNDQGDVLVADEITIDYYAEQLGVKNELRQIGDEVFREEVALGVDIYDIKLCNILNKKILEIKKDRSYSEAQTKWLGSQAAMITDSTSVWWVQWIIFACVGFVIIAMIWESLLNRKLDQRTRELQIERNNLQTTIDNIDSLVAIVNSEDVIMQCNSYGKIMLGDEAGRFIGCGIGTLEILRVLNELYAENPNEPYYYYNGKYYSVSVGKISGEKGNRLLMITDSTSKYMSERKNRQESKMAAVGQLSAGLAHEIRNPLGLIRNYAYILKDIVEDDMGVHAINVIEDSTGRIDKMIENLLSFSRISNDEPVYLNLDDFLAGIMDLEHKKLEKGGIKISLSCPKNLVIRVSEETLKMTAFNLINNAVDALNSIKKDNKIIKVKVQVVGDNMLLQISDNGPGMSEDVVENIFNPFFTTKDTGTGLGLYIVGSELEKINGSISVESILGEGTTFTVNLPILQ